MVYHNNGIANKKFVQLTDVTHKRDKCHTRIHKKCLCRTGPQNIAAALVVAGQNFDTDVITYLMVVAISRFVVLFPAAGELGKRARAVEEEAVTE